MPLLSYIIVARKTEFFVIFEGPDAHAKSEL